MPGTGVVMADGTTKAIEDVEVGQKVLATDPETGEQSARTVAATIDGEGAQTLVQITVDGTTERDAPEEGKPAGPESASQVPGPVTVGDALVATDGHPFWVPELDTWVDAIDLAPGMWLQTSAGTWVQIGAVQVGTDTTAVHNLTVTGVHTYHVVAGDLDVLNHNCGGTPSNSHLSDLPVHSDPNRFWVRAGELLTNRNPSHPVTTAQMQGGEVAGHGGVANLSNAALIRRGDPQGNDPIRGYRDWTYNDIGQYPGSTIHITGGHHRTHQIASRVRSGDMSANTLVEFLISR